MTEERAILPNWTGLLSWSTKQHDGTGSSHFGPMDEERKRWLVNALTATFEGGEDPNQVMKKAAAEIESGNAALGLDMLDHTSDYLDCADNVDKVGALKAMVDLISSTEAEIVTRTLMVLGAYIPNNPRIQLAAALKHECVPKLKGALALFPDNLEVKRACLSCLGSLIRNVVPLENSFLKENGIRFMTSMASESNDNLCIQKVCSVIISISGRHPLTDYSSEINNFIVSVYTCLEKNSEDIQLGELAAGVIGAVPLDDKSKSVVKARLEKLQQLPSEDLEDFMNEIDSLTSILS